MKLTLNKSMVFKPGPRLFVKIFEGIIGIRLLANTLTQVSLGDR